MQEIDASTFHNKVGSDRLALINLAVRTLGNDHVQQIKQKLRKTDHTRNVYPSTRATSKTTASTPDKLCPHTASAMNRQLWLRQALSALNPRNSKSEKPDKNKKSATQDLQSLSKSQYTGSQMQPIPLHERPLLLRLQPQRICSLCSTAGAS